MAKKFICKQCGQTFEAAQMPDKCPICGADTSMIEEVKTKKGIDTSSNVYTVVYAAVMVVIAAFLLAFVSSALKSRQDANVENDTKGQILTALGYDKSSINVGEMFADKVQDNLYVDGDLVPYEGKFNTTYGNLIKQGELHVFTATTQKGQKAYVIPVTGRGLWGGLWGYIALDEEKKHVLGTYFYHESETAGLGARIGEREFQQRFEGRPVLDGNGNIALTVVKQGAGDKDLNVDGITGATLTSKGVGAMVTEGLSAYVEFINK